jgi:hypothetical protein
VELLWSIGGDGGHTKWLWLRHCLRLVFLDDINYFRESRSIHIFTFEQPSCFSALFSNSHYHCPMSRSPLTPFIMTVRMFHVIYDLTKVVSLNLIRISRSNVPHHTTTFPNFRTINWSTYFGLTIQDMPCQMIFYGCLIQYSKYPEMSYFI